MKPVYLLGFMGSGKSLLGSHLARSLGFRHLDTDIEISLRENKSIADIFRIYGESYFRKLEIDLIKEYSSHHDIIISSGGGLPCSNESISLLKSTGTTLYLFCTLKLLAKRLWDGRENRPLLANIMTKDELKGFILTKLLQREEYYFQADFIVDANRDEHKVIEEMVGYLTRVKYC